MAKKKQEHKSDYTILQDNVNELLIVLKEVKDNVDRIPTADVEYIKKEIANCKRLLVYGTK